MVVDDEGCVVCLKSKTLADVSDMSGVEIGELHSFPQTDFEGDYS